jgi:predicted RNA binding protein YcfA (HicA-like mRNA interferase family)
MRCGRCSNATGRRTRLRDGVTAREVMNRLRREGWAERGGKGSHRKFSKPGYPNVIVPNHRGDLKRGLLRSIAEAAGWEWPPQR